MYSTILNYTLEYMQDIDVQLIIACIVFMENHT